MIFYPCQGGTFMKYEWKRQEKEFYGAKKSPSLVTVPAQNYIMISGKGNPNDIDFSNRVSALYSLAYAIKMAYKATATINEFSDFTVFPLEGIWQKLEETELIKEKLEYTIMIRQPDFIYEDMVKVALERVKVKKPNPLFDAISFGAMQDGKCVEILHIGAFDDEPISFEKMEQFILSNNLERTNSYHREIYLNNANRVEKSKLKTILRYAVK